MQKRNQSAMAASKKIRLFDKNSPLKQSRLKSSATRKPIPNWVDVDDDEEHIGRRKRPTGVLKGSKVNHGVVPPPLAHSTPPRKKARLSNAGPSAAIQERHELPIAKGKEALVREIAANEVTVLLGETGSGKTTRESFFSSALSYFCECGINSEVPQYLLEAGFADAGLIGITQPRRVAAMTLAARVAKEQGTTVGQSIGYAVRFDERAGPETRVKYMTDGMITRELLGDPLLSRYAVIIVDEAHERTLRTDLLLATLKRILPERNGDKKGKGKECNPLKVVIMSATLDAEKFSRFFDNAKILYVKGRQHPVKIYHTAQGQTDYVEAALRTFFQIHLDQPPGDVLIFLPGQEDIESLEKSITQFARRLPIGQPAVMVLPMFASLQTAQLQRVFATAKGASVRKCILATNIAETSITIPGVRYVIDTGKSKEKRCLAGAQGGGFDTLFTRDITKSNAMQRAGRAGREGPGFCYRLYTEDAFKEMTVTPEPEILRCSLTHSILQLLCIGQDIQDLDLMDMPDVDAISSAFRTLFMLGALDSTRTVTPLGRAMVNFPLEPPLARAVMASKDLACTAEVLDIVSVLAASGNLFLDVTDKRVEIAEARRKLVHTSGDHLTKLGVLRAYRAVGGGGDGAENDDEKVGRSACKEWVRQHFVNERTLREATRIRDQLREACARADIDWRVSCGDREEPVLLSFTHGLAMNVAFIAPDGSYKRAIGQSAQNVKIHPSSSMADKKVQAIIYDELVYTNQIYARGVSSIPKHFVSIVGTFNRREA
ncbi:P-loop containing nucleoside triphosphate hydrolase protein [Mycena pura]|uniref:RNA helicase n=1 Tax=Mycena pura TaxID=153505 RepID=A0AAD6V594_9AGAR|nr:P-loop containing nucleoside triphosphate hydrolase protein [Mycena pura]